MPLKKILLSLTALVFLSSVSGCLSLNNDDEETSKISEGGGISLPVDEGNPAVFLTYPITPEIMTLSDSITLFGGSTDTDYITNIKVNGLSVLTEDNFETWQVELPLTEEEDLTVSIVITNQSQNEIDSEPGLIIKHRGSIPMAMGALTYDSHVDQIYFFEADDVDELKTWDLNTGRVSELNTFGHWDDSVTSMASMLVDELGKFVYYATGDESIYKLELATGISTTISLNSDFTGSEFEFRYVRALYMIAGELVVVNSSGDNRGVFNVNLDNGARTLLHSLSDVEVRSVGYSVNNNAFYIGGYNEVLSYDLDTDSRAVLSENLEGDTVVFNGHINKLAVIDEDEGGARVLVPMLEHDEYYYIEVDVNDGSRTKLIEQGDKALDLADIGSLVVDNENSRLFIEDDGLNRIYQLDLNTMTRTLINGVAVNSNEKTFFSQSDYTDTAHSHDGSSVFMLEHHERSFFSFGFDLSKNVYMDVPEGFGNKEHYLQSYSPETSQVFITESIEENDEIVQENILVLNTETEEISVLIADRYSDSMIFNPHSNKLYVAVESDINISEIDLTDTDNISEVTKTCDANENAEATYEFLTMNSESGRLFVYDDGNSSVWMWNVNTDECEELFDYSDSRLDDIGSISGDYAQYDSVNNRFIFLSESSVSIVAYNLELDTFDVLIEDFTTGSASKRRYDLGTVLFDLDNERLYFTDEYSATLESFHIPTEEYHIHIH